MNETDLKLLCRICMTNSSLCSNIFVRQSENENPLYEVINYVYDLEISIGDGLPEYVCRECLGNIKEFANYKRNAHVAKRELILLREKNNVFTKVENEDYLDNMDTQVTADVQIQEPQILQKRKIDLCDDDRSPKTSNWLKDANYDGINYSEYHDTERMYTANRRDLKQEPDRDRKFSVPSYEHSGLKTTGIAKVETYVRGPHHIEIWSNLEYTDQWASDSCKDSKCGNTFDC